MRNPCPPGSGTPGRVNRSVEAGCSGGFLGWIVARRFLLGTIDYMTTTTNPNNIEAIDEIERRIYHVEHVLLVAVEGRQYHITVEVLDGGTLHVHDIEPAGTHPALSPNDLNELEAMAEELQIADDECTLECLSAELLAELLRVC